MMQILDGLRRLYAAGSFVNFERPPQASLRLFVVALRAVRGAQRRELVSRFPVIGAVAFQMQRDRLFERRNRILEPASMVACYSQTVDPARRAQRLRVR